MRAATNFAAVCAKGDATALYNASLWLDDCFDGWRFAMLKVARLEKVSQEIQQAFVPIWVEHKTLPLKVAERSVLAKALRVLMPGGYSGAPLRLYRGANARERRRRIYGFSWTTDITIARNFVWFSTDAFKQRCVNRDFPIPGSPDNNTVCPSPLFAFDQRRSSRSSSSSRPTRSVTPVAWRASKRLSTDAGRKAVQVVGSSSLQ